MSRNIRDLSPEEASALIERYLFETTPPTRKRFIALVRPIIQSYDERNDR